MNANVPFDAGGRLEYFDFHFCSKGSMIRVFKDRSIDDLFHYQLPTDLLYFLYRLPESHMGEFSLTGPTLPSG